MKLLTFVTDGREHIGALCDDLADTERRADYSGVAVAVVGSRCRAPLDLLAEIAAPLVIGACKATGRAATIKSARALLAEDAGVRRAMVERALHGRVVLAGHAERGAVMAGVRFEVGDDPIVELERALAQRLGVRTGDRVALHLPISDAGQLEATRLAEGQAPVDDAGWVTRVATATDREAKVRAVLAAARIAAVDPGSSYRAALLVGGWPYRGPTPPAITP